MGHWTTIATMPAREFAPVALGCADDVATLADTQCVSVLYSIPLFITLNVHVHKKKHLPCYAKHCAISLQQLRLVDVCAV